MKNKYYVTREGYEKLYDDINMQDKLHDEVEKKMGESVKRDNDLRENPEYMLLRVQAMYGVPNEKKELLLKYYNAVIIEEMDEYINWDGVTVIRKCDVELEIDGVTEKYTILGENEGDLNKGILSCAAPLVKSILGKKVGQTIVFNEMCITVKNVSRVEKSKPMQRNLIKK